MTIKLDITTQQVITLACHLFGDGSGTANIVCSKLMNDPDYTGEVFTMDSGVKLVRRYSYEREYFYFVLDDPSWPLGTDSAANVATEQRAKKRIEEILGTARPQVQEAVLASGGANTTHQPQEAWLVITGNPIDGFSYYGPYESSDAATTAGDHLEPDWWVASILPKEELK